MNWNSDLYSDRNDVESFLQSLTYGDFLDLYYMKELEFGQFLKLSRSTNYMGNHPLEYMIISDHSTDENIPSQTIVFNDIIQNNIDTIIKLIVFD